MYGTILVSCKMSMVFIVREVVMNTIFLLILINVLPTVNVSDNSLS